MYAFLQIRSLNKMNLNDSPDVYGSIHGLWHGQHERVEELNSRVVERQFPDHALRPNYAPRPVSTKYVHFPTVDVRKPTTEPLQTYVDYRPEHHFSPATRCGPTATYLANVDVETRLQNRHIRLQHGDSEQTFVPHASSDLFGFTAVGRHESLGARALLFRQHALATDMSEVAMRTGQDLFHNNTRTQLRGL